MKVKRTKLKTNKSISQFHPVIRIVASILLVAFLAQDIAWAYPDVYNNSRSGNSNLAPQPFTVNSEQKAAILSVVLQTKIENHKLFLGNVGLPAIERSLYSNELTGWCRANSISYEVDRDTQGDPVEIRLLFPEGGILCYYDPTIEGRKARIYERERSVIINPHLHKKLGKITGAAAKGTAEGYISQGENAFAKMARNLAEKNIEGERKFANATDDLRMILDIDDLKKLTGARSIEDIMGVSTRVQILVTNAVRINGNDFALGFNTEAPGMKEKLIGIIGEQEFNSIFLGPTIVLTTEVLLEKNKKLRQEYIYHELVCGSKDHYEAIFAQQKLFPENYEEGDFDEKDGKKYIRGYAGDDSKPFKGALGAALSKIIQMNMDPLLREHMHDLNNKLQAVGGFSESFLRGVPENENDLAEEYKSLKKYSELIKDIENTAREYLDCKSNAAETLYFLKRNINDLMSHSEEIAELGAKGAYGNDERARRNIDIINSSSVDAIAIINSAIYSSGRPMEKVDAKDLIDDMYRSLNEQLIHANSGITLDPIDITSDLRGLKGIFVYKDIIRMTVEELVKNAIKYSKTNSIKIGAALTRDGEIIFTVRDFGKGITEENLKKIFIAGFTEASDKRVGTGYGLSSLKDAIESVGGNISVSSVPGEGTTFSFTTPSSVEIDQIAKPKLNNPIFVVISGLQGSGRTVTARWIASKLGLRYINSGFMVRAMIAKLLEERASRGIDINDEAAVTAYASEFFGTRRLDYSAEPVKLDGMDTAAIDPKDGLNIRTRIKNVIDRGLTDGMDNNSIMHRIAPYSGVQASLNRFIREVVAENARSGKYNGAINAVTDPVEEEGFINIMLDAPSYIRAQRANVGVGGIEKRDKQTKRGNIAAKNPHIKQIDTSYATVGEVGNTALQYILRQIPVSDGIIRKGEKAFISMVNNMPTEELGKMEVEKKYVPAGKVTLDEVKKALAKVGSSSLEDFLESREPVQVLVTTPIIRGLEDYSLGFYSHAPAIMQNIIERIRLEGFKKKFPRPTVVLSSYLLAMQDESLRIEYILQTLAGGAPHARLKAAIDTIVKKELTSPHPLTGRHIVGDLVDRAQAFKGEPEPLYMQLIYALIVAASSTEPLKGESIEKIRSLMGDPKTKLPGVISKELTDLIRYMDGYIATSDYETFRQGLKGKVDSLKGAYNDLQLIHIHKLISHLYRNSLTSIIGFARSKSLPSDEILDKFLTVAKGIENSIYSLADKESKKLVSVKELIEFINGKELDEMSRLMVEYMKKYPDALRPDSRSSETIKVINEELGKLVKIQQTLSACIVTGISNDLNEIVSTIDQIIIDFEIGIEKPPPIITWVGDMSPASNSLTKVRPGDALKITVEVYIPRFTPNEVDKTGARKFAEGRISVQIWTDAISDAGSDAGFQAIEMRYDGSGYLNKNNYLFSAIIPVKDVPDIGPDGKPVEYHFTVRAGIKSKLGGIDGDWYWADNRNRPDTNRHGNGRFIIQPFIDDGRTGGLIGKVYRDRRMKDQVKTDVVGIVKDGYIFFKDGKDGKKRNNGRKLYTKDGAEARVKLTGATASTKNGFLIYYLEPNDFIKGFASSNGEIFMVGTASDDPVLLYHEMKEALYNADPDRVPYNINPHTFLRGCGKDLRRLVDQAISNGHLKKGFGFMDINAFIRSIDGFEKNRKDELRLIAYNAKQGRKGVELLYGEQDRPPFSPQENMRSTYRLSRRLAGRADYSLSTKDREAIMKIVAADPKAFSMKVSDIEALLSRDFDVFKKCSFKGAGLGHATRYYTKYRKWSAEFNRFIRKHQDIRSVIDYAELKRLRESLAEHDAYMRMKLKWIWTLEASWSKIAKILQMNGDWTSEAKEIAIEMIGKHHMFMDSKDDSFYLERDPYINSALESIRNIHEYVYIGAPYMDNNSTKTSLIGKAYRDKEGKDLITKGIGGAIEGQWLVLYSPEGKVLYTGDGKEARIRITDLISHKKTNLGYELYTIEPNEYIHGFACKEAVYMSDLVRSDRVLWHHEMMESYYSLNPLPPGVNSHTKLRGCGKKVREIVDHALRNRSLKDGFSSEELKACLKHYIDEKRWSASEMALIDYNASKGMKGMDLLYGEQDFIFGSEANQRATGKIAGTVRPRADYTLNAVDIKLVEMIMKLRPDVFNKFTGSAEKIFSQAFNEFTSLDYRGDGPIKAARYFLAYKEWYAALLDIISTDFPVQAKIDASSIMGLRSAVEAQYKYIYEKLGWILVLETTLEKKGLSAITERHKQFMKEEKDSYYIENDDAVYREFDAAKVEAGLDPSDIPPLHSAIKSRSVPAPDGLSSPRDTRPSFSEWFKDYKDRGLLKDSVQFIALAVIISIALSWVLPVNVLTLAIGIILPVTLFFLLPWTWKTLLFNVAFMVAAWWVLPLPWLGLSMAMLVIYNVVKLNVKLKPNLKPTKEPSLDKRSAKVTPAETAKDERFASVTIEPEVLDRISKVLAASIKGDIKGEASSKKFDDLTILTMLFDFKKLSKEESDAMNSVKGELRPRILKELRRMERETFSERVIIERLRRSEEKAGYEKLVADLEYLAGEVEKAVSNRHGGDRDKHEMAAIYETIGEYCGIKGEKLEKLMLEIALEIKRVNINERWDRENDPIKGEDFFLLAALELKSGNFVEADKRFKKAVELEPANANYMLGAAIAKHILNDYTSAAAYYKIAASLYSGEAAVSNDAKARKELAELLASKAPSKSPLMRGDKKSGNMMGKLFIDKAASVQVKEGITAKEEGGFVAFLSKDNNILFTKDGQEARVKLTGKVDTDKETGIEIKEIEDNEHIKGFADDSRVYIASSIFINPIAKFHETKESYYSSHPEKLPEGVNAHTYLRGCGKDIREALDTARRKDIADMTADELIKYLKKRLPKDRHNETEFNLITHNGRLGRKGIALIYGLQDEKYTPEANELFSETLAVREAKADIPEKASEETDSRQQLRSPEEIYLRDYFESLCEKEVELHILLSTRMMGSPADKEGAVARRNVLVQRLLALAREYSAEKFSAGQNRELILLANQKIFKTVELINDDNEPAAEACLFSAMRAIEKVRIAMRTEWLTRMKERRSKGWRQGNLLKYSRGGYQMLEGSKRAIIDRTEATYTTLWETMRSLFHQVDGELEERRNVAGWINAIKGFKDTLSANNYALSDKDRAALVKNISKAAASMSKEKGTLQDEDKRIARILLNASAVVTNLGDRHLRSAGEFLDMAESHLKIREEDSISIATSCNNSGLGWIWWQALKRDENIKNKAKDAISYIRKGNGEMAIKLMKGILRMNEMKLEPEYREVYHILWPAIRSIEGEERKPVEIAIKPLNIIMEECNDSLMLHQWLRDYRDMLLAKSLSQKEPVDADALLKEVFEIFTKRPNFLKKYVSMQDGAFKDRIVKARAMWWAKFNQAVKISLNIDDPLHPGERVRNLAFDAASDYCYILSLKDPARVVYERWLMNDPKFKVTKAYLEEILNRKPPKGKDYLMRQDLHGLVSALSKDYGLDVEQAALLDSCVRIEAEIDGIRSGSAVQAQADGRDKSEELFQAFMTRSGLLSDATGQTMKVSRSGGEVIDNALVLYADNMLEQGAVIGLEQVLRNTDILDYKTIIAYGKKPGTAELLAKIIRSLNSTIKVLMVGEPELINISGDQDIYIDEAKELASLIKYAGSKGIKNGDMMGVIKGATADASVEKIKALLAERKTPVVSFESDKGVYSFADALNMIQRIHKINDPKFNDWFTKLPAIKKISAEIDKTYQDYREALNKLLSSA